MAHKVEKGVEQLEKAEKAQKRSIKIIVILVLIIIIILLAVALVLYKSLTSGKGLFWYYVKMIPNLLFIIIILTLVACHSQYIRKLSKPWKKKNKGRQSLVEAFRDELCNWNM